MLILSEFSAVYPPSPSKNLACLQLFSYSASSPTISREVAGKVLAGELKQLMQDHFVSVSASALMEGQYTEFNRAKTA